MKAADRRPRLARLRRDLQGGAAVARIYVSSTYSDLQEHRAKVYRVLRQLGHDVVAMEDYVAADERPVDRCLADVAECDLYLGIFAHRYGNIPERDNPDRRSVTELEYRHAEALAIPRLAFLLDVAAAWPPGGMDAFTGEGDRGARIHAFREELGRDRLTSFFSTPDELAQKVSVAVIQHRAAGTVGVAIPGHVRALDLASYFKRLEQQYASLDLNALTPPKREEYLQILLRSVFVEQQVRAEPPPVELPKMTWELLRSRGELHGEDRFAGLGLEELYRAREVYQRKPARPVLDVLTERGNRLVMLLGDPGAGKSTLARYLTLALVEGAGDARLEAAFGQHLPLLVELRAYAGLRAQGRYDTFLGFLAYLGRTEGYGLSEQGLDDYLRHDGRAVVVFDGLDELFDPAERETVSRQIAGFATRYERARVIVTSRIIGYRRQILDGAGFSHYTLQDLDRPQIETFVRNWYDLVFYQRPEEAEPRRRRLAAAVENAQSIRELAGNPLLLTILAIIGKHQELPRERWKLYDHAAGVLVQHWDVNKHLADERIDADLIDEEDKKELLRRIALRMHDGRSGLGGHSLPAEGV
jgi:energy-coupling factor transporter ATP-binding protein EcfA2